MFCCLTKSARDWTEEMVHPAGRGIYFVSMMVFCAFEPSGEGVSAGDERWVFENMLREQ